MQINLLKIPVFFINLNVDPIKRKKTEELLSELGFEDVRRFSGFETSIPKLGCATSHNLVLREILKIPGPVLVFEDDISVTENFASTIEIPSDSDAVYLGTSAYGLYQNGGEKKISAEKYNETFYRMYNMLAAHAILYVKKDYIKFLIKATQFMIDIHDNQDKARAATMRFFNIYSFDSPMFFQNNINKKATSNKISELECVVGKIDNC
jgi:GR25 family glycosyltransferase involved in LPS biosynthesis